MNLIYWLACGFGILFNGILTGLIIRNTPKTMRIYSKILLQTCFTDISLLLMTLLFFPYCFTTEKGEMEEFVYGLVTIKGAENRIWNLLALICWIFLVYVSMFGYVSQFVFRYFVLVRAKSISSAKYFLLFFLMLLFPFAYCVSLFICFFPSSSSTEHAILEDKSVAEILGINLDQQIVLAGYSFNDARQPISLAYIITVCTFVYLIICTLAFRIENFLKNQTKISASFGSLNDQMIELNKQISRTLIVQASMPLIIYLSVLFLLAINLFKIDTKNMAWLQYYNLFSSIPQIVPSALNPIVSIWMLRYYRNPFVADIKGLVMCVRRQLFCHPRTFVNEPQQQQNNNKWAISVAHYRGTPSKQ
ncbi:hypothetical protein niasHS_004211 [Heterodera schachtii]|uniref:Uncharacterized protein n=1 Tax=Heterodera schachtii TaxID=97005 RepID=A0ABD2JTA5_HETSC